MPSSSYGQATEIVKANESWWLGKSREELTTAANKRAETMGKTPIGRTVAGRVNTP